MHMSFRELVRGSSNLCVKYPGFCKSCPVHAMAKRLLEDRSGYIDALAAPRGKWLRRRLHRHQRYQQDKYFLYLKSESEYGLTEAGRRLEKKRSKATSASDASQFRGWEQVGKPDIVVKSDLSEPHRSCVVCEERAADGCIGFLSFCEKRCHRYSTTWQYLWFSASSSVNSLLSSAYSTANVLFLLCRVILGQAKSVCFSFTR